MSSARERRGLGRGLEVLLGGATESELAQLPIDAIHPNPRQPRRRFDSDAGAGLADSIRAAGVVQPVLVRPRTAGGYELIAGERRWRAARDAKLKTVPRSVRLAEAPSHGLPAIAYDRRSRGADAYWKVAMELVERA